MNRDDIIRMAREAGLDAETDTLCRYEGWVEPLERFAALVAAHTLANIDPSKFMSYREGFEMGVAAEREACAKVCESEGQRIDAGWSSCAVTIRARGQQ